MKNSTDIFTIIGTVFHEVVFTKTSILDGLAIINAQKDSDLDSLRTSHDYVESLSLSVTGKVILEGMTLFSALKMMLSTAYWQISFTD